MASPAWMAELVAELQDDPFPWQSDAIAQSANDGLRLVRPHITSWQPRPMPFGWVPDATTPPLPRRRSR